MKKSVKDMEPKELQKYVEKLEKENKTLKRNKRNLERRLTTSQNKSNKYRSELKKKRKAERRIGQGDLRTMMSLLDDIIIHP